MKITVNRESLVKVIDVVARGIQKTTIHAWECLYINVVGEKCYIYSRSSDMQIKGYLSVESDEDFEMCVPAAVFCQTIRLLTSESIVISSKITVKEGAENHHMTIISVVGQKKKYRISSLNPKVFNVVEMNKEKLKGFSISGEAFVTAMATCSPIVNPKDLREMMSGVSVRTVDGNIEVSATDGTVIARMGLHVQEDVPEMMIPKRTAMMLDGVDISPQIKVGSDGNNVVVKNGPVTFIAKLLNGKFPPVKEFWTFLKKDDFLCIDRNEIINALKRLNLYSKNEHNSTKMTSKEGVITLKAVNHSEANDAFEEMDVVSNTLKDCSFSFSSKYMIMALEKMTSDEVRIHNEGGRSSIFLFENNRNKSPEQMWLVAPISIKERVDKK